MKAPDVILVGGGLANGLLAERLLVRRPELKLLMLEAGAEPGGNHTWSFHGTDVSPSTLEWLAPWASRSWEGHDVAFPSSTRALGGRYFSIRSHDFARRVRVLLGADCLRCETQVKELSARHVVTRTGERLDAALVIDGRGFSPVATTERASVGFQKFLGLEVTLEAPHGLQRPLLMDATVAQLDGFRFVYALPWDERRVLVEDTRYSDSPVVDAESCRAELSKWMHARGWVVQRVERTETAALPIPLGGEAPRLTHPTVGVAAGLFHSTTGYSVPFAAETADFLAGARLDAEELTSALQRRIDLHWERMGFFRMLNRMLFRGARPASRVDVFESFYRHRVELIERFYAGRLTWTDKVVALQRGAPTVPLARAVRAVLST